MAQLYFRYGAMNSGKSIDILKVKHNYEEQGKKIALFTNSIDDRDGVGVVSSRIGISKPAIPIKKDDVLYKMIKDYDDLNCILVDEAQFLTNKQVRELAYIVDKFNVPVIAYGLKNDFQNKLFEGSEALLIYADKIEEIKTMCWYCDKKATMNLRISDGKAIYDGEQVQIGGNESYLPTCRKHYYNPII